MTTTDHPKIKKNGRTPPERAIYFVIGGSQCGKYAENTWPKYPTGQLVPRLPLTFICRNDFDTALVDTLAKYLTLATSRMTRDQLVEGTALVSLLDRLKAREKTCELLTEKVTTWSLISFEGGREFIAFSWPDAEFWKDQQKRCMCKRTETLYDALKLMFTRNIRSIGNDEQDDLEAFAAELNSLQINAMLATEPALRPEPQTGCELADSPVCSADNTNVTASTTAADVPSVVKTSSAKSLLATPKRQAVRKKAKASSAATRAPVQISDSEDTTEAVRNDDSGGTSADCLNKSHGPSTPELLDDVAVPPIFLNLRDINGHICGHIYTAAKPGMTLVPSCGDFMDNYLDRDARPAAFIERLYHARRDSKTLADFTQRMQPMLAVVEAEWYWKYMDLPEKRTMRTRAYGISR